MGFSIGFLFGDIVDVNGLGFVEDVFKDFEIWFYIKVFFFYFWCGCLDEIFIEWYEVVDCFNVLFLVGEGSIDVVVW